MSREQPDNAFIGIGWAFPPTFSHSNRQASFTQALIYRIDCLLGSSGTRVQGSVHKARSQGGPFFMRQMHLNDIQPKQAQRAIKALS